MYEYKNKHVYKIKIHDSSYRPTVLETFHGASNWMGNEAVTPTMLQNYRFRLISSDIEAALMNA